MLTNDPDYSGDKFLRYTALLWCLLIVQMVKCAAFQPLNRTVKSTSEDVKEDLLGFDETLDETLTPI